MKKMFDGVGTVEIYKNHLDKSYKNSKVNKLILIINKKKLIKNE